MADLAKPILTEKDIWASQAEQRDVIVPWEKVDSGWTYADKPSFQSFNWFWQNATWFFVSLNQHGIPHWDSETNYYSGALVKRDDIIFQTFGEAQGDFPYIESRNWTGLEFIEGLHDVEIDKQKDNDVIVYRGNEFSNESPANIKNIKLTDLNNITADQTLSTMLVSNSDNNTDLDAWTNKDTRTFLTGKINISDVANVMIDRPVVDEILQYREVSIYDFEDDASRQEMRWVNTYNNGYVNYHNITGKPYEFQPQRASENVLGGARMWISTENLNIDTDYKEFINAPFDLVSTTDDNSKVTLTWVGTTQANGYRIYRDGVEIDTTGVGETQYEDVSVSDNIYHVYYVTAFAPGDGGSEIESYPSNHALGVVRPTP
jgi:hypothetical protein